MTGVQTCALPIYPGYPVLGTLKEKDMRRSNQRNAGGDGRVGRSGYRGIRRSGCRGIGVSGDQDIRVSGRRA